MSLTDNKVLATNIYEFLKSNGYYSHSSASVCIAEMEEYLTDPNTVMDTIKDIEGVSDSFLYHNQYLDEAMPLLRDLREIHGELEAAQRIRMVGETKYEVKHAIHIGDKEIIFAEDKAAENGMCWLVGDYTSNDIIGQYADCQVSDDFLEAMQEFTDRVSGQITAAREEITQSDKSCQVFTAEHCHRNDYGQSIDGKIVAIRAETLRPEYRRGEVQIVLVNGGNGTKANPMGRAVYCYHLNDGKHTRFDRSDIQGEVKAEFVPKWAAEKAAAIQAEKAAPPQKKPKDKEER